MERVEMSYLVQQNRTENLLSESRVRLNPCLKKKIISLVENELIKGVLYSLVS